MLQKVKKITWSGHRGLTTLQDSVPVTFQVGLNFVLGKTEVIAEERSGYGGRVILCLDLVSPECSTCSQIITNTQVITKTPDLD